MAHRSSGERTPVPPPAPTMPSAAAVPPPRPSHSSPPDSSPSSSPRGYVEACSAALQKAAATAKYQSLNRAGSPSSSSSPAWPSNIQTIIPLGIRAALERVCSPCAPQTEGGLVGSGPKDPPSHLAALCGPLLALSCAGCHCLTRPQQRDWLAMLTSLCSQAAKVRGGVVGCTSVHNKTGKTRVGTRSLNTTWTFSFDQSLALGRQSDWFQRLSFLVRCFCVWRFKHNNTT